LRFDHINQISPEHFGEALSAGIPADSQTLLPSGFNITRSFEPLDSQAKIALRRRLGLPLTDRIILSVGAVSLNGHKRFEYLIEELARMPEPRPFLVILGEKDKGTNEIERRAAVSLGASGFTMRTEPRDLVDSYYKSADLFVLASLREGFGRVYVEALAEGLQCIAHDYLTSRYVLGSHGIFGDLNQPAALAELLYKELSKAELVKQRVERHRSAYERFSWDKLAPLYVEMLTRIGRSEASAVQS